MTYVDGFVIPLPKKNLAAYRSIAKKAGKIWMEHGALAYHECIGDDVPMGKLTSFPQSVKLKAGEVVVFSWIVYKSRKERDRINAKVMKDPRLAAMMNPKAMPFDGKRLIFGGFKTLVEIYSVMRYLHTMLRVRDLDASLAFFVRGLGLTEARRRESEGGRFTLVFLASGADDDPAEIELTYNWDQKDPYATGRFFGHLAFEVDDIYASCTRLQDNGIAILRPPRDGRMAFIKSPDGQSVELLQRGAALMPSEPWASMPNQGEW